MAGAGLPSFHGIIGQSAAMQAPFWQIGRGADAPVLIQGKSGTGKNSWRRDARMRKRDRPEAQHGLAPLAIRLGPTLVAGGMIDIVVETRWEQTSRLGRRLGRT